MNDNLKVLEKEYFRIKAVETSKDNFKLIYNASEIVGHVSFEVDKIDDEVMHMTFDFEREYVKFVHLREVLYLLADYYFNDLNLVRFVCFVDIQKQRIAEIFKEFGFMVLKNVRTFWWVLSILQR